MLPKQEKKRTRKSAKHERIKEVFLLTSTAFCTLFEFEQSSPYEALEQVLQCLEFERTFHTEQSSSSHRAVQAFAMHQHSNPQGFVDLF